MGGMNLASRSFARAGFNGNVWLSWRQRRSSARRMEPQDLRMVRVKFEDVSLSSSNDNNTQMKQEKVLTASVAERALAVVTGYKDVDPYYKGWQEAQSNPYDAVHNPGGCIQLGLSENRLCLDLLEDWFSTHNTAPAPELESLLNFKAISGYPEVNHGLLVFRNLISKFMDDVYGGGVFFDPEKMVVTNGATCAIETLAFCLADPGDVFLVPAPYYQGFVRDIKFRSQVKVVPVPSSSENDFFITRDALERTYEDSESHGRKVKAVLITSPDNPRGNTYSQEQLLMFLDFVREKNIHLISDEIYAGTVFGTSMFTSVAELVVAPRFNPSQVHILFGLSKILSLPGFRIGVLYSWNSQVLNAAAKLSRFTAVPTPNQKILIPLLADRQFLQHYLSENHKRLRERWSLVKQRLQEAGLRFVDCTAGFFCWVNIGQVVAVSSKDEELKLWRKLLYEVGLNVTPGSACQCTEVGWFRLCYCVGDYQTIVVALDRLKQFIDSIQQETRSK